MYRARAVCTSEGGALRSTYSPRAVHIPCTVKNMRQLSCTDRPYKATARLASVPEYSTYSMLAVQGKVPYAGAVAILV